MGTDITVSLQAVYRRDPDVVFRKIADEYILVPVRQKVIDLKCIYSLNDVSAYVWKRLDGKQSLSRILKGIVEDFDVAQPHAAADLQDLITQLQSLRFIHEQ